MSALRIEQAEFLSGEDQAFWRDALRERYFGELTIPWTEAVRAAGPRSLAIRYLQVCSGSERRALVVLHLLRGLDLGGYVGGLPKIFLSKLAKLGWRPLAADLAFLEIPGANTCGIRLVPDAEGEATEIGNAVLGYVKESFRYSLLCLKTTPERKDEGALSVPGMLKTGFLANTSIAFQGERSFEDYVKRLDQRARWAIRSYSKVFREGGGEIAVSTGGDDKLFAVMHELYARTLRYHAEHSNLQVPIPLGPAFFPELSKSLPGAFRVFVAKLHGQPIGFMLGVGSGDATYLTHCGLDYERSTPSRAYFNLYYSAIADAIERGAKRLSLGAEAYETKKKLGAVATPTAYHFEARNPALRAVMSLVARNFSKEAE